MQSGVWKTLLLMHGKLGSTSHGGLPPSLPPSLSPFFPPSLSFFGVFKFKENLVCACPFRNLRKCDSSVPNIPFSSGWGVRAVSEFSFRTASDDTETDQSRETEAEKTHCGVSLCSC